METLHGIGSVAAKSQFPSFHGYIYQSAAHDPLVLAELICQYWVAKGLLPRIDTQTLPKLVETLHGIGSVAAKSQFSSFHDYIYKSAAHDPLVLAELVCCCWVAGLLVSATFHHCFCVHICCLHR